MSDSSDEDVLTPEELREIDKDSDSQSHDSSWSFFERTESGARCAVCRELVSSSGRRQHLREHHPKLLHNEESEEEPTETANDTQEEVYTELVYLENEETPKKPLITEAKEKVSKPRNSANKRRRDSSSSDEDPLITHKKKRNENEIDHFGKYIICLMKKLPNDACLELQMDIVNMILKKQLDLKRKETSVLTSNMAAVGTADIEKKSSINGYSLVENGNKEKADELNNE